MGVESSSKQSGISMEDDSSSATSAMGRLIFLGVGVDSYKRAKAAEPVRRSREVRFLSLDSVVILGVLGIFGVFGVLGAFVAFGVVGITGTDGALVGLLLDGDELASSDAKR
mgnify:CR=1 FL=1